MNRADSHTSSKLWRSGETSTMVDGVPFSYIYPYVAWYSGGDLCIAYKLGTRGTPSPRHAQGELITPTYLI
jgi:hypothetical protein